MDLSKSQKIELLGIFISIFISTIVLFKEPFEFYVGYIFVVLYSPALIRRYGLGGKFLLIFVFFLLHGMVNIYAGDNTYKQFFKIFLGVSISYIFYNLVIKHYKFNIDFLYKYFLKGVYIVSVIGLIQLISFKLNFRPGYDYSWLFNKGGSLVGGGELGVRVSSIFGEPSYFAIFISPGLFVAIHDLFYPAFHFKKYQALAIIAAFFLSFSGIGYTGIFICVFLILINYGVLRYGLIIAPALFFIFSFVYQNVSEFRERLDSTIEIFTTGKFQIGKTHGSSIILYNNYHVAVENFKRNPFGTGLGSHPIAFEKYSLTKDIKVKGFNLNSMDGNSMFVRLLSETGIIGLSLMFIFILKFYVTRDSSLNSLYPKHWIISNSILVLIILSLLRQGHYFLNGFPFFMWLYYYSKLQVKESVAHAS